MIKRYFNKTISIFLTMTFLFGLFPPIVFAGPSSQFPTEIMGSNKTMFENSFSKADREINSERWLSEAKLGLSQVIYSWELIAFGLYEDPSLFKEAKDSLVKWSNDELESRFSNWLIGRFFGEAAEKTLLEFSQVLSDTQKKYSWHLDSEGNVIFDDRTGDPLVIRPGEENREFSEDITKWKNDIKDTINASSNSYENIITQLFPELLAYIPPELREKLSSLILESASVKNNAIKREFENIAAREERIFTSRRTRDIWSLRNKSENEAAKLFTERLITETDEKCRSGIEELNIKIEQAEAGVGDLALLGEEWLRLYKEQFEKGLKAWEDAEERFFIRRIEWEQDSIKLFSEGEEIWLSAFNLFEEERQKWELNAKNLFKAGEALFINLSDDFVKNITEAKKEFELNMAMRIGEGTTKVKALIDMYLTYASTAISLKETIFFWQKESNMKEMDPSDPNFSDWLSKQIVYSPLNKKAINEIGSLYKTYLSYMEKAVEIRDKIFENYTELLSMGTLKDILSPDASSEDFYLDEYQIALVRAKALVLYWERKTAIAEAVINYAEDLSSNRITEAEGIRAWEEAKDAYNKSLADYETELKILNEKGSDIKNHQELLSELALNLQKEEEILNALLHEYNLLISLSISNNSGNFFVELIENYNNLVDEYRNFEKSGEDSVYKNVLINGLYWGEAQAKQNPDIEWQETLDPLVSFFNSYGYNCESYYLPDVQDICEIIFNKDGDFAENSARFLLEFDNCFSFLPNWLETEINTWKNALLDYISVYAFYFNKKPETSISQILIEQDELIQNYNEYIILLNSFENLDEIEDNELNLINNLYLTIVNKRNYIDYIFNITTIWENINSSFYENNLHWRQLINNDYFDNLDYLVSYVSSWSESILIDSFFNASYFTNRLNDAFILYSQKDTIELTNDASYYYLFYLNEYSLTENRFNSLLNKHTLVLNSINAYELSKLSKTDIDKQITVKNNSKNTQEGIYNAVRELYLEESNKFIETGLLYDEQYGIIKNAYAQTDLKRFEYEKQDAIQRWASTSYINSNREEYENSKNKLQKAQIVLEVLSDLYSEDEERLYEDPKYDALYFAYKEGFNRKLTVLTVVNSLSSAITNEIAKNNKLFQNYQYNLYQLGNVNQNYSNYYLPEDRSIWSGKDMIMLKDGLLAFTRNENFQLTGVNSSIANELNVYFNEREILPNEKHEISQFEKALRELNERMLGYFSDSSKFLLWSLARDYLISSLIDANGDISFLNNVFSGYGELTANGSIGTQLSMESEFSSKRSLYSYIKNKSLYSDAKEIYLGAWNSLSQEERADLEFYIIITLTNSNGYSEGFSLYHTLLLYETVYNYVEGRYEKARYDASRWQNKLISFIWDEMKSVNKNTLKNITTPYNEVTKSVKSWMRNLESNNTSINYYHNNYIKSCQNIDIMQNIKDDGEIIWEDINNSLLIAKINQDYLDEVKTYWEAMQSEMPDKKYNNVFNALVDLLAWAENKENVSKIALNNYWNKQIQTQQKNEIDFLSAVDNYISGNLDINSLKKYAETTYGITAASWKNHYANMHVVLFDDISLFTDVKFNFLDKFSSLGNELLALTKNTIESRYLSEYAVRESEWRLMQNDILNKYNEWQNAASLILENGRMDWVASLKKMENAYKQWYTNFQNEYERVNNEWNEIYLAGLEDKEKWLEQASNAANQASSESFLSLVGTEGERLSRFIDTREPLGIRDSVPQAQLLMNELLQSPGITSMASAFNSLTSYAGITSPLVRRGMGGLSAWDASSVKIAASDLAKKSNSLIADNEAKILAHNVQRSINEAINGLNENVKTANKSFKENMDSLFIFKGLWRKNGENYVKDVVKGSTLFTPVISETVNIKGFANYIMEPINLQTNLNEYNLINLNSIAINSLVENAYLEVKKITSEIFGFDEEPINIDSKNEKREQSPGKFGAYIGYAPDTKPNMGKKRDAMFYDEGAGELGRLISEFTYWKVIDSIGMGELAQAPWDKRMWNDEGSKFTAPSLRTTGQIVGAVVAAIVSVVATPFTGGASLGAAIGSIAFIAAINTSNDLMFNSLDASYGYKTWDEAAFEVRKSYTTNFASGLLTAGFSGYGEVVNGTRAIKGITNTALSAANTTASTIATQTIMTGMQTMTTGFVTSVISGITYNSENGFGYSGEIVGASMKNMLTNSLVSMSSVFTSSSLTAINSGVDMEKLTGFNKINQSDLQKLNNLAGSLAGQGVNYALGNDFTLNILNLSLLPGKNSFNTGLLELHLGRNGTSMNFGTGGANVSIDNLAAVFRGAQVWDVNSRIGSYIKNQGKEGGNGFDSYVTLRAQYGYGDSVQKGQLWDILKGDVTLSTNAEGDYSAQTTINENGNRVINLAGYQQGMSIEDQFLLATILGHEAYRDGIVTTNNYMETRTATMSHTKMALRIIAGGEKITINDNLMNDITAYAVANKLGDMSLFNNYVDANYDSSADYWRVIMNANGSVDKILWDGDYTNATIVEADGTERFLPLQAGSVTQALAAAIGNGITKNQVNSIMLKSGLDFNNETKQWYAKEEYSIYTPTQIELPQAVSNPLKNITDYIGNKAGQALDAISNGFNNIKNLISGLFGKGSDTNENTVNSKKGNTFTITDSKGNDILLYSSDKENHVLNELLQQTDPAFASIPVINEAGCNFLATLAYAQLVTGKALSSEQIISIWKEAEKNPDILNPSGFVKNQNKLAEMALQKLGRTDIGLNFGGAVNGKTSTLIGYRVTVEYNTQNVHHTTGDISKQILWNPDIRNTNTKVNDTRSVYVYAKN